MSKARSGLPAVCPKCKKDLTAVEEMRNGKTAFVLYNAYDDFGPHRCPIARTDPKYVIKVSNGVQCKGCGKWVAWIEMGGKKFPMETRRKRHVCSEHLFPPRDRFWSNDGSAPGEYMILEGKLTNIRGRGTAHE